MKSGECPKCGAAAIYRLPGGSTASPINALRISRMGVAPLDTYVCVSCGYTEQYVVEGEKRSAIADHWQQVGPQDQDGPTSTPGGDALTRRLAAPPGDLA
ncbi:MAG TPA: hypothetical protein VM536_16280 [Chloroflexia bacterium]|nr:hypothetical protein [Chloroflexia bacterium]